MLTGHSRGVNESSDLDQVGQNHFNEYLGMKVDATPEAPISRAETLFNKVESQEELMLGNSNHKYNPIWGTKPGEMD